MQRHDRLYFVIGANNGILIALRRIGRKPMGYRRSISADYAAGMLLDAAATEFFVNAARAVTAA
jgi:hypothetical protein